MGDVKEFPIIATTNTIRDDLLNSSREAAEDCVGTGYALVVWDDDGLMNINWTNNSRIPNNLLPELLRQGMMDCFDEDN